MRPGCICVTCLPGNREVFGQVFSGFDHARNNAKAFDWLAHDAAAGQAVGRSIAALPEQDRPDGIVAANDLVALGILQALTLTAHIRVPEDIAVVGYDDIDFAAASIVPLTSIRQPRDAIARESLRMLLLQDEAESIAPAEHVLLVPELVVRESTRGVRG